MTPLSAAVVEQEPVTTWPDSIALPDGAQSPQELRLQAAPDVRYPGRGFMRRLAPLVACLALTGCKAASDDGLWVNGGDTVRKLKNDAPISQQEDQQNGSGNTVRRGLTGGQAPDSERGSGGSGLSGMWERAQRRARS